MINKKIKFAVGFAAAMTITMGTFAAELSQDVLQQCVDYINNPTDAVAKQNANALNECVANSVCQTQLSNTPNCMKQLNLWQATAPQPNIALPAAAAPTKAPTANTDAIPTEFHSTQPTSVVTTPAEAVTPQTESVQQPVANANQNNNSQPTQKKQTKPKINWF